VVSDEFIFPLLTVAKNPAQLSSDQIFLGLMMSFRFGHLTMAHFKMGQALKSETYLIEWRLFTLYGYRLNVCERHMQVHIAAARMGIEAPQERLREVQWRYTHNLLFLPD
jgi:hypothetical protein